MSQIAEGLPGARRCLGAHPGNPPYLLPIVELVPSPVTEPAVVDFAEWLLRSVGMSPVRLKREIEGFIFNRLQGAVLREAYCLVRDGVASPHRTSTRSCGMGSGAVGRYLAHSRSTSSTPVVASRRTLAFKGRRTLGWELSEGSMTLGPTN